ncbi:hypothetical protein KSS87_007627 [Heliosperma pusillum]|nr:hypothetical protein KSS87_007627 [Heliosperma pusillum]
MQSKAINFQSPYSPLTKHSSHFPLYFRKPTHFNPPISKPGSNPWASYRISCVGPNQEILGQTHQPNLDITDGFSPEIEEVDYVDPTRGIEVEVEGLSNQNMWEQIVEIVKFSGPATGIWICGPLMSLIDTAVIGQASSLELAALGPGTVLCDYVGYIFMFLSIATSNMVANSLAQQDENKVQHQISMLLFLGLASGVVMLVLTKFFGEWALTAFVGEKNMHLVPAANLYTQPHFYCLNLLVTIFNRVLIAFVLALDGLGMKDSLGPLKALLIASALNGIGDIVLCLFLGYGIAGAAWATAVSQIVAAYAMVDALNRKGYNGFSFTIPSIIELKEIFEIATPVFVIMVSKVTFYGLIIYFATSLGTHVVAAHQVLAQIYSMCSVWGEPLSQTAQSFMPELLYGPNRNLVKARSLLKSLLIIGVSVGVVLGAVATSIPWLVPGFFTPDLAVIGQMHSVWIMFFLALCVTPCVLPCEGTLLAGRDLKFISTSMFGCFALGALALVDASSLQMACYTQKMSDVLDGQN